MKRKYKLNPLNLILGPKTLLNLCKYVDHEYSKYMQGTYTLLIELIQPAVIPIGKRGNYSFKAGYYAYVGSALNGLETRIGRHLRKEKKLHWHIDYLLEYAEVRKAVYAETDENRECLISKEFLKILKPVPGFGCSDCRCLTHLYYHEDHDTLKQAVLTGFGNTGLLPLEISY